MNEIPSLPEGFLSAMRQQPGLDFPAFLKSYEEEPARGARVRGELVPPDALSAIPWCDTGYYLSTDSRCGAGILHEAGAWYLQEPSAMIPAAVLPVAPGDRVLDLCAAPGGKSTQLSARLGDGLLVSNEIVPARAEILSGNLERMGCENTVVTCAAPETLAEKWPGYFDKVLVDAPCSGEGMFRRHPMTRAEWTPDSPGLCAARQKRILSCAARMLRPGGMLLYSTCTFNALENEMMIGWLLETRPEFEPVPFSLPGLGSCGGYMHIWPHLVRGEGHFAALLRKNGEGAEEESLSAGKGKRVNGRAGDRGRGRRPEGKRDAPRSGIAPLSREERECCDAFLREHLVSPLTADGLFMGRVVKTPREIPLLDGVRVLRCGLHLGEFRGRVFWPDHALSHAKECLFRPALTAEQAAAYLRGETLSLPGTREGFCTPVYEGMQLGWGKVTDGVMKNHYPKGLRRNVNTEEGTIPDERE